MGKGVKEKIANARLRKSQGIKGESQGGEWYAVIDADTGSIKYLRKKIKKRK